MKKPSANNPRLKIEEVPIESICAYGNNPRKNSDAIDLVADSIRDFGWQQPIVVDKHRVIIVGHTRYAAAESLGLETVPITIADNLTDEQVRAYRLVDNRSNELSEWDEDKLLDELVALESSYDAKDLGFEIDDIDPQTLELKEWIFCETHDEYILTVRGPLDMQAEVRKRLEGLTGATIEASSIEKT